MKLSLFIFLAFAALVVTASAVSGAYFVPTSHASLEPLISLDFGNQLNVMTSFYGEDKELFFDSIHRSGYINLVTPAGGNVLVSKVKLSKLNFGSEEAGITEIPVALDGKPTLTVETTSNGGIVLNYNVLSQECGGNYKLSFDAVNTIDLNERREVNLLVHIPCKTDLMVVLSPLMGKPTSEFLSVAKSYFAEVAKQGKTARFVTLSAVDVATPKLSEVSVPKLAFDSSVFLGRFENLLGDLQIELSNSFSFDSDTVTLKSEPVLAFFEGESQTTALRFSTEQTNKVYTVRDLNRHFDLNVIPKHFETEDRVAYIVDYSYGRIYQRMVFVPEDCRNLQYFNKFPFTSLVDSGYIPSLKGKSCTEIERMLPLEGKSVVIDNGDLKLIKRVNFKWAKSVNILIDGMINNEAALHLEQQRVASRKIKNTLDKLRLSYAPKYILLIGSVEQIPMGIGLMEAGLQTIPSDSIYSYNTDKNQIEIPIARIPVALDEPNPWIFVSNVLRNIVANRLSTKLQSDKTLTMLFDACGYKDNCFMASNSEAISSEFSGPCTAKNVENPNCLSSEPVCVKSAVSNCVGNEQAIAAIGHSDYLYIDLHGSGYDLGAQNEDGRSLLVLRSKDITSARANSNLIISNTACYGGAIDADMNGKPIFSSESTTFAFLERGSPLLIANSRPSFGIDVNNLDESKFDGIILAAIREKDTWPAGDMVIKQSNKLLKSSDLIKHTNVWVRQIYGDLLLPFYKVS